MGKKFLTDEEVKQVTEHVISFKGRPWSESEFNATKTNNRRQLAEDGATEEQLKEFDRIINEAPIIGGSFNTWSGD